MRIKSGYITENITLFAYTADQDVEYIGKAAPGSDTSDAVWQITKLTYDGNNNITTTKYASGNKVFDKIWDNRANYVYS